MSERPIVLTIHNDEALLTELRTIAASVGADFQNLDSAAELFAAGPDRHGCLICDHCLKDGNAIELLEKLRCQAICLPMIIVARDAETRTITKSMQSGAFTVLDRSSGKDELWDTIRKAIELDQKNRRSMAECAEIDRRLAALTPKEMQVLELIIEGHANKVIASRLGVSVRTVESRRHSIFKSTQTKSLAELVAMVYRHELWRRVLSGQAGLQRQPLLPIMAFGRGNPTTDSLGQANSPVNALRVVSDPALHSGQHRAI